MGVPDTCDAHGAAISYNRDRLIHDLDQELLDVAQGLALSITDGLIEFDSQTPDAGFIFVWLEGGMDP